MKALEGAFNQEKALVGGFSVIVKTESETDGSFILQHYSGGINQKRKCDIFHLVLCHLIEHVEEAAQLHHTEVEVLGHRVGDLRGAPHVHQVQL